LAGADVLLVCRDQDDALESMRCLEEMLIQRDSGHQRLEASLRRIAGVKSRLLRKSEMVSFEAIRSYFGS
jgi:hypothetical protein